MRAFFSRVSFVRPWSLNAAATTRDIAATITRQLIGLDTIPKSTAFKAFRYLSVAPSSRLFSTSLQHRLIQPRTLNSAHSRTFALEGHATASTPNNGAAQKSLEGTMTASTSINNASSVNCLPKRRASCELLPIGLEHAPKQRIVPVNYGTSVFFNRTLSSFAASRPQETSSNGTKEASPSSPSAGSIATSTATTAEQPRAMVIQLTDQEAKICEVLDQVAKNYEVKEGKKVELRIAGGWVRDKLLGLSCHDLDIGLDTMMGYEFAVLVNDYMESLGKKKRTIAKIATNPEKSKHLETATMMVLGMPLDFVNLRSEVYDDSSRIPSEITFGTPKEDAERRDITINALFYNIHTHKVEDYTGMGLKDLQDGIVRTPLEAYETFWQDPLRVLRCIRFASRFQFTIAEDAKQAILDSRIKQVLKTKISKERIGSELDKMIDDGAGRSTAIRLLQELGLYDVVFAPPEVNTAAKGTTAVEGSICEVQDAFKLVWIMEWILKIHPTLAGEDEDGTIYQPERDVGQELLLRQTQGTSMTSHLYPVVTSEPLPGIPHIAPMEEPFPERLAKRTIILSSMLYPYREMTTTVNKKIVPAGSWILRYGLKGRNVEIDIVTKMMESIKAVQETVASISLEIPEDQEVLRKERADMGMLIRDIGYITVIGKKWRCALLLGLGVDLIDKFDLLKEGILDDETKAKISKYNAFLSKAEAYQIDHCFSWKYIVDGKEITQLLKVKPGPKVTDYLQKIMQWQLQNPHSSKEECQAWIREHSEQFK
ncbi:CCA tRNA nucleotidyltransferase, mitochondrial [Linnemannia schmuckeri]|uniref:CCA tRNA nucleotidyltransferase, mitochondrial n=1 Tax=Linnemannia schmuckeri TaxID=64567 RepID=A0A9P5VBH9_9FUNG|nr:CCA tRNA nucleotidyltransferase, mitochondrial [Linnemannia schmuckeri]